MKELERWPNDWGLVTRNEPHIIATVEVCYGETHAQLSRGQKLGHYVSGPVAVPLADCVMSGPLV